MKKKLLLSIIPCVIILGIVLTLVLVKPWKAKSAGKCTVIVVLKDKELKETVSYQKNDTLSGIVTDKFNATFSGTFMTSIGGYTPDVTSNPTACEYWAFYYNDEKVTLLKEDTNGLSEEEKNIIAQIKDDQANWKTTVKEDLTAKFAKKSINNLVSKGYISIKDEFIYSNVGVMEAPLKNKRTYKFVIETYDSTLYN